MTLGILAFAEGPLSSLGKQDAVAVVTGLALTSNLGTASAQAGAQPSVTGQSLTSAVGTVVLNTTSVATPSGEALSTALGTPVINVIANPTVSVTGFGLTQTIGTYGVTAGGQVAIDASSEPDLDLFLGDETVVATANTGTLTGQSMSTALGTVSVDAQTP